MPASKTIELITKKLDSFGLNLDKYIVASVTDGASLMKKIGYDAKPEHQMCYNHAIHLCTVDVLFKKNNATLLNNNFFYEDGDNIEAINHDDDDDNKEKDENPIEYVQNIQISTEGLVPSLTTEFQEPVAKIRKLVQMFRRSPVRNDDNLQPNIVKTFGKEKVLICDSRTKWSSTIAMLELFLEVQKEIKIALISKNIYFLLSRDELDKVNNLCVALKPLKLAIEAFSKRDADLLSSEIVIQFIRKKLDEANTLISQLVKQQFEKRIVKRRNINLIHLMKYLFNPDVLNQDDQFGNKIKRNIVANFATNIIQRLFQPNV